MDVVPAGSRAKELATMAMRLGGWRLDDALSLDANPMEAMATLDRMATPAKLIEPGGVVDGKRGPRTDKLINALRLIGAKISPTMGEEQINVWLTALVMALSDLPFAFAQRGAEDALHVPMRYLNEVEGIVRDKAGDAAERHKLARLRLERLQREIANAGQPKLEAPKPMTPEEYQAELNSTARPILATMLKAGAITQEQHDTAIQGRDEGA